MRQHYSTTQWACEPKGCNVLLIVLMLVLLVGFFGLFAGLVFFSESVIEPEPDIVSRAATATNKLGMGHGRVRAVGDGRRPRHLSLLCSHSSGTILIATEVRHDIARLAADRIDAADRISDQHSGGALSGHVVTGRKTVVDRLFDPIDNFIYLLIGRRICGQAMDWKAYTLHMLATNLVMALIIFLILVFQDQLPLNPQHFAGMEPMLAFNTAVSFITNTDWQAYGGETTLSNFSQMAAITFPMFTSATTGFVVAMAFIRAFTVSDGSADLGNFYRDLIRFTTRVLMPVAFVLALVLIQQGEPQTLAANVVAHTVADAEQTIALGPVASFETIKHFGTNGGGFFNANAAHPYENPTPITNLVQILLMIALPSSIVICFGVMIGNRRQAWVLYGVMSALLIIFLPVVVVPEQAGTPLLAKAGIEMIATTTQPGGNMEGKEVRFGVVQSGLFASITTTFTTGSVNSMLDSFTPVGGMGAFIGMMLQCVFGGKGVGFLAALVYGIIAVFVAGLMVGRTPEFLGKKIEKPEIVLVSLTLLVHPLVILVPTRLVSGRALWRRVDGQCGDAWLFRGALRIHHFRRQ